MGELSRLAMGAFGLSGGFLYRLFPGPRYAYRAMVWYRLLPPDSDPGGVVSGEDLLYITGQLLSLAGEEYLTGPDAGGLPAGELPVEAAVQEVQDVQPDAGPDVRLDTRPGEGLSSGAEGVMPYEGEFKVE
jgi:hypothetical protein